MDYRRLASLLIGGWIAGSLFMTMVATQNFRGVDRLLAHPTPAAEQPLKQLGAPQGRALLRAQVGELNRRYFALWEWAQLCLGAALLAVLGASRGAGRAVFVMAGLMLLAVLVQRLYLTPEVARLGTRLEAMPAVLASPERTRFRTFHAVYSATELGKLGLAVALAVIVVRQAK